MKDESLTPKATLIDMRLRDAGNPGLLDYVHIRRGEGAAWKVIAQEVEEISGLRVTDMGLRYWLDKADLAPAGDAA